jgi:hypothetical protein
MTCGAALPEREAGHCAECGGSHLLPASELGGRSERRPPTYGPGDHAALLYDSDERFISVVLPYVRDGVAAGNRVVGVVDHHSRDLLRSHLTSAEARRLEVVSPGEQYGDSFSAERTYDAWSQMIASTDGVLRGFGGLDGPTARAVDPGEWARYEDAIGDLLLDDALGLCLYDARYCPQELLDTGAAHSLLGARDKVHVCR